MSCTDRGAADAPDELFDMENVGALPETIWGTGACAVSFTSSLALS